MLPAPTSQRQVDPAGLTPLCFGVWCGRVGTGL